MSRIAIGHSVANAGGAIAIGHSATSHGNSVAIGYYNTSNPTSLNFNYPPRKTFEIRFCGLCHQQSKTFTCLVPPWSKFTHWFFWQEEKKIATTILKCWRFSSHFISKLPKDILFIIIAQVLEKIDDIRPCKAECDDCTKVAVTTPQCSSCFGHSIDTEIDYVYAPNTQGVLVAIDKICIICKQFPVYVCKIHRICHQRSCICEKCHSIGNLVIPCRPA